MTAELANYNLFDYERRLATRELEALTRHSDPLGADTLGLVRGRSTYFQSVDGEPTIQALTESSHHALRGSRVSRQATRYLVHGLHEYKGKFNPQMARALINVVDPSATALMDPFCGSGTTLVEGLRLGLSVVGIDQNPLAVWMSQVKLGILALAGATDLVERFDLLTARLLHAVESSRADGARTPAGIVAEDDAYLRHWFPEPVLSALWAALQVCRGASDPVARVAELGISNIVRQVSWQLPEDLRIRRRSPDWTLPDVALLLAQEFRKARSALAEISAASPVAATDASVRLGSSRDAGLVETAWPGGRKLVVTSPPYATALPYIDTDRLSIVLLGLAPAGEVRELERELTGSREWRAAEAALWREAWATNAEALPDAVLALLERIDAGNRASGAGFRRQAVPGLLYRYFAQMGETLDSLAATMGAGERVVMVVGSNRTGAVEIPTPELLGLLSATRGFDYTERIPLETWARYGMHSRNAVSSEDAIVMTARG